MSSHSLSGRQGHTSEDGLVRDVPLDKISIAKEQGRQMDERDRASRDHAPTTSAATASPLPEGPDYREVDRDLERQQLAGAVYVPAYSLAARITYVRGLLHAALSTQPQGEGR